MTSNQKGPDRRSAYDRAEQRRRRRERPGMKLRLVVQHDAVAGRWSAVFPEIPGCASAGDTEQEAVANAKEALALWFEPRDLDLEEGARIFEVAIP